MAREYRDLVASAREARQKSREVGGEPEITITPAEAQMLIGVAMREIPTDELARLAENVRSGQGRFLGCRLVLGGPS